MGSEQVQPLGRIPPLLFRFLPVVFGKNSNLLQQHLSVLFGLVVLGRLILHLILVVVAGNVVVVGVFEEFVLKL